MLEAYLEMRRVSDGLGVRVGVLVLCVGGIKVSDRPLMEPSPIKTMCGFFYLTVFPYLKWESLLDTDILAVNCLLVDTSLDMSRTWKNAMSRRCLSSHFVRQPRFAPSHYVNVG